MRVSDRAIGAVTIALLVGLAGPVVAQDYMGMVEQHGWNLQNTLQTEIMNDAGRNAMEQAVGAGQGQTVQRGVWPAYINDSDARSRIFLIDELVAMHSADPDRMRAMIDGQVITVQGRVERNARADSSFHLAGATDGGYRVWAYWRRGFDLPVEGSTVTLRGQVEMERRSQLNMREAEFVAAQPVK